MGIFLLEDALEAFLKKYKTKLFESYGVVKKDWTGVSAYPLSVEDIRKYTSRGRTVWKYKENGPHD